jgi:hypothetical protein
MPALLAVSFMVINHPAMNRSKSIKKITRLLWILVWVLATIGVGMVVRRVLILAGVIRSVNPAGGPPFDTGFGKHPVITLLHILPGLLFMILGPLQFMRGLRTRRVRFYRGSRVVFIICAYIAGLSALSMPFIMKPIGGVNEAAGSILFAVFFLVALSQWVRYLGRKRDGAEGVGVREKNEALAREWMIRAFAIGLAIATVRPIMVLFFAFSGLPPSVFFGTAFWIGFTLHLIAAEVWIHYTREGAIPSF